MQYLANRAQKAHKSDMIRGVFLLLLIADAAPALADDSIQVPEPGNLGLLALAVIGLVIGRRASRQPPHDDSGDA